MKVLEHMNFFCRIVKPILLLSLIHIYSALKPKRISNIYEFLFYTTCADKNDLLWPQIFYGIISADDQLIDVVFSQIGNTGGEPYLCGMVLTPVSRVRPLVEREAACRNADGSIHKLIYCFIIFLYSLGNRPVIR